MHEINIMNGNKFNIVLGTNIKVNAKGNKKFTSTFLKNSISSNKFRITPKVYIIKITIKKYLKKLDNI